MPVTDTRAAAQAVQLRIQQAMSGEQRLLLALEMSLFARDLAKAGIRQDHPDWTEAQVARELVRLAFLPEPLPAWLDKRLAIPDPTICPRRIPPL